MRRLLMIGCLLVAATGGGVGCFVGPSTKNFRRMAQAPEGAAVEVDLGKERPVVSGELLEVRDTALLVRDTTGEWEGGVITLVPFRLVHWGRVPARGATWRGEPRGGTWDRLRLLSRFPYGLAAPQLQALLAAYRRDSLTVVR